MKELELAVYAQEEVVAELAALERVDPQLGERVVAAREDLEALRDRLDELAYAED